MAGDSGDGDGNFLRRWSQRKLAASRQASSEPPPVVVVSAAPASVSTGPVAAAAAAPATASAPASDAGGDVSSALPPIDSLRFDSDFTRFLAPKVDEAVKRQALRKLFSDPRFNVMDGLDVYIDDYSKFEPIPEDLIGQLRHARYIFDPPKTRVTESGHVEDVADEPPAALVAADAADAAVDAAAAADAPDAAPAPGHASEPPVAPSGVVAHGAETNDAELAGTSAGEGALLPPAADVVERKGHR